jgi:hypothetical protein
MSGERPKAPLWPEGISKVRPVENQRAKALREGVSVPVAKEPELRKPGEQPVHQPGGTPPEANVVFSGEPVSPGAQSEGNPSKRLGKPLSEVVGGEVADFVRGRHRPEQQGRSSRRPEPIPRSKKARTSKLIDLYHQEIHLPSVTKELTPEDETQLRRWVNSLSYKELGQEIRKQQEKLDKDFRDQWPPPNSIVRV